MKTLSPTLTKLLENRFGIEFYYQVVVKWNTGPISYSRSDIVSVSDIEISADSTVPGSDFSCSIILQDTDGALKTQFNTRPLINTPVSVYVKFDQATDAILIGSGNIVTPVKYLNNALSFTVFSGLVDNEVGFSTDDLGLKQEIKDLRSWPMIFGKVCAAATLSLPDPITGTLKEDEGIADYTLPARICQVQKIQCPVYQTGGRGYYIGGGHDFRGNRIPEYQWEEAPQMVTDPECVNSRRQEYCRLVEQWAEQRATEHPTMTITGGNAFPQGKKMTLNIDGGEFTGYFSGNTFHIQQRKHPMYDIIGPVSCDDIPYFHMSYVDPNADYTCNVEVPEEFRYHNEYIVEGEEDLRALMDYCTEAADTYWKPITTALGEGGFTLVELAKLKENYPGKSTWEGPGDTGGWSTAGAANRMIQRAASGLPTRKREGGAEESRTRYYSMPSAGLFTAKAGSEVRNTSQKFTYLVSLIPGTITKVMAYKQRGPAYPSVLVELPADFYSIEEVDMGGYTAVQITMNQRPSEIDPCLSDDIYVDFESDIGPNPVDIIRWFVNRYTDLSIDETSFNYVHGCLENYPIGFILTERPKIMDIIKDIAFQARCVLFIYNNTIYIKYYSEAPTSVGTISDSDIFIDTKQVTYETDLATSYRVKWKSYGVGRYKKDKTDFEIAVEHHVDKYGYHKKEDTYQTVNNKPLVKKTATFWMLRYSNLWKTVTFEGPLSLFRFNIYDGVTFEGTLGVITKIAATETGVSLTIWLPIRLGESSRYLWAWPARVRAWTPLYLDTTIVSDYDVVPPEGHPLSKGSLVHSVQVIGDEYPSDLDDGYYAINCKNNAQSIDSIPCDIGGNGPDGINMEDFSIGASTGTPPELKPGTTKWPGTCWWHYTVFINTCELVYCGDPGPCEAQDCQCSHKCCRAPQDAVTCVTKFFGTCGAAWASYISDQEEEEEEWCNGKTKIFDVQPTDAGDCYNLPHKLWKEPNAPGEDRLGIYHDCYHLDNGLCVPRDYYCDGPQSNYEQVAGLCTEAQANKFREDNLDRPEVVSQPGADSALTASTNVCDAFLAPGAYVRMPSGRDYHDPDPYLVEHDGSESNSPPAVPETGDAAWWSFSSDPTDY